MCGVHRDRLCTVLGCESGASEANRLSKRGVWGQGRAESVNLPPELYSGRRGQDLCVYLRQSTLLPYASLVRVSRKSVLLDDRRRGRRSVILELGEASYNPPRWHVCCDAFSKVSGKCQVAPEVNKIRPLASAISPADTIPH